jgi:hypothetical protein
MAQCRDRLRELEIRPYSPAHAEIRLLSVDPGQAGAIVRIITQFFCPFDRW